MTEDREFEKIITPCGHPITVVGSGADVQYMFVDGFIWNPKTTHRTALLAAMYDHDGRRYREKNND